jgi:Bacterial signalling protein N terminal repeat
MYRVLTCLTNEHDYAGSGIWATHFVAMLAYRGAPSNLLRACGNVGIPSHRDRPRCLWVCLGYSRRWCVGLGGAVIGIAIVPCTTSTTLECEARFCGIPLRLEPQ